MPEKRDDETTDIISETKSHDRRRNALSRADQVRYIVTDIGAENFAMLENRRNQSKLHMCPKLEFDTTQGTKEKNEIDGLRFD